MELGSNEAVTWFTDAAIRSSFLEMLHPGATIKSRDYHIVVQFVPLTFKHDNDEYLREVEDVNGILKGSLVKARWIKPAARQTPQQTCGHAIFSFSSPQSANEVLTGGLFICQKKVYAAKCRKEPLWCLKCHEWGHMV